MDKPYPNVGISDLSWSFDSNFLATLNGKIKLLDIRNHDFLLIFNLKN
jgi:hypothetical protein